MNPKTKLKDLKYEIPGEESNRPGLHLLYGCITGFIMALVSIFLLVTFGEQIDKFAEQDADNGAAVVILFIGVLALILAGLKKWIL